MRRMTQPDPGPSLLPAQSQPLLAALTACGLVAMAGWFVTGGGFRGGLVHYDAPPPPGVRFTLNVNAASATELSQLPGLGPALAQRIVDHRKQVGPFATIDELLDVSGIGPATLDAMRPHIRPIRRRSTPESAAATP
jgi:competence ComEA-like helix-hairpin-helix protein